MFERFTDRARRVVVLAQEEARDLNHNYIGTEHLLLGLVHESEGVAARALESLGISLEEIRNEVVALIGHGQQAPSGHIPFTPRAKKILELSLREALQLGHSYIGTEHILLGLIREGDGVACQVLMKLGVDLNAGRAKVVELLHGEDLSNFSDSFSALSDDRLQNVIEAYVRELTRRAIRRTEQATKAAQDAANINAGDLFARTEEMSRLASDPMPVEDVERDEVAELRRELEKLRARVQNLESRPVFWTGPTGPTTGPVYPPLFPSSPPNPTRFEPPRPNPFGSPWESF